MMFIHGRTIIAGVFAALVSGCGTIDVLSPSDGETLHSYAIRLEIEKDDQNCTYRAGSFNVVLDPGQREVDITNAFSRIPGSDVWVANRVEIAEGTHALTARADFIDSVCGNGRTDFDSVQFAIRWVRYETPECGTGEFTYEPYPARLPEGATQPPVFRIRTDANCVRPGSTLDVRGLDLAYPDIAEIRRVEFVILHTRWDPDGAGGRGAWFRLADPTYYEVTQFSRANRGLIATIPGGITGEAPAAASIRITYLDQSGDTHVVDLERNYTQVASRHRLFFVPRYHVFGAEVDVVVGFDAFPRTIDGVVLAPFATNPGNWEEHCRIRSKGFSESGFPGELEFIGPQAEPRRPTQGYRIQMPAFQSGRFTVSYQVVCPDGVDPTGRDLFMRWGFLGEYPSTTVLVRGMPPIESVRTRP